MNTPNDNTTHATSTATLGTFGPANDRVIELEGMLERATLRLVLLHKHLSAGSLEDSGAAIVVDDALGELDRAQQIAAKLRTGDTSPLDDDDA